MEFEIFDGGGGFFVLIYSEQIYKIMWLFFYIKNEIICIKILLMNMYLSY